MGECALCSGDDDLSFRCNECGNLYCSSHRLPESHNCDELKTTNFDGAWFGKQNSGASETTEPSVEPISDEQLDSIRTQTGDADSSDEPPETLSETCLQCGRATLRECEKCGSTYCKAHRAPTTHNCALLNVDERDAETPGLMERIRSTLGF